MFQNIIVIKTEAIEAIYTPFWNLTFLRTIFSTTKLTQTKRDNSNKAKSFMSLEEKYIKKLF